MNRSILGRLAGLAALAIFASSTVACGPDYDRLDITPVKGENVLGSKLDKQELVVPEGLVLTAFIVPWNDDDEKMPLAIFSDRTDIVEISPVVNDRNYSFIGKAPGTTTIRFVVDGNTVLRIPANVIPQPEQ
jgi:hypothetical protein